MSAVRRSCSWGGARTVDGASDLRPDDSPLGRQVRHLRRAIERQQVMLAEAGELDVAHEDQIVVVGAVFKHPPQMLCRILRRPPSNSA